MTATTAALRGAPCHLLRGVDEYRPGEYRVRLSFPGQPKRHTEFLRSADQANRRILELRELRSAGLLPADGGRQLTLGEAASEVLALKRIEISRKTGRPLTPASITAWARLLKPWLSGPHAATPTHLLPARKLTAELRLRSASHPKAGRDELAGLKTALRHARGLGAQIPEELLEIEPPAKRAKRRRRALTLTELDLLVSCAPAAYGRLVAAQGSIGNRISELLLAAPSHVDLKGGALLVPRNKEQRPKRIPLLPEEIDLLAEQLGALRATSGSATEALPATPRGSALLWPMPDGSAWPLVDGRVANAYFDRHIWQPSMRAAAAAWEELPEEAKTEGRQLRREEGNPFAGLTSHDLRATAITHMRDRGISAETCAHRVGHADGGGLVRRIYDQGSAEDRAARELAALPAPAQRPSAGLRLAAGGAAR